MEILVGQPPTRRTLARLSVPPARTVVQTIGSKPPLEAHTAFTPSVTLNLPVEPLLIIGLPVHLFGGQCNHGRPTGSLHRDGVAVGKQFVRSRK